MSVIVCSSPCQSRAQGRVCHDARIRNGGPLGITSSPPYLDTQCDTPPKAILYLFIAFSRVKDYTSFCTSLHGTYNYIALYRPFLCCGVAVLLLALIFVELDEVVDVLLAAKEDRAPFVDICRYHIEDALPSSGCDTTSLILSCK